MKYFVSLPINSRSEKTFIKKFNAAKKYSLDIKKYIQTYIDEKAEIITPFDFSYATMPEPEAIGKCMHHLLECDAIVLEHHWRNSKGCRLEQAAAVLYEKGIFELPEF